MQKDYSNICWSFIADIWHVSLHKARKKALLRTMGFDRTLGRSNFFYGRRLPVSHPWTRADSWRDAPQVCLPIGTWDPPPFLLKSWWLSVGWLKGHGLEPSLSRCWGLFCPCICFERRRVYNLFLYFPHRVTLYYLCFPWSWLFDVFQVGSQTFSLLLFHDPKNWMLLYSGVVLWWYK